jgi:diacylglycerol kinase (ATP)
MSAGRCRADDRISSGARGRCRPATGIALEPQSPFKSRGGAARLLGAMRYSYDGLRAALRDEAAFRQELALSAVLVPLALWLPLVPVERLLLIGSLGLVLVVELLNSAIESAVDRVGAERHTLSKRAKDLGSAAVMLSLLLAAGTWLTLLWPLATAWARGA